MKRKLKHQKIKDYNNAQNYFYISLTAIYSTINFKYKKNYH